MGDVKADMAMTDPPYILDYLNGKSKNGKPTEGFGYKKDRKYLETDVFLQILVINGWLMLLFILNINLCRSFEKEQIMEPGL